MKKHYCIAIVFTLLSVCTTTSAFAQKFKYYQMFIYNFTKYIQWPPSSMNGEFVIGVLGSSDIVNNLKDMAHEKKIGNNEMKVVVYNSVADIDRCHIIFIPDNKSKFLDEVLAKTNAQSTLVITERDGLGKAGSCINFIIVSGKLRFELNKAATNKANLKVSGDLAKLAIVI